MLDGVVEVAVKLMRPEISGSESSLQKFVAEIDLLRACRHANIVAFLGAFHQDVSKQAL